MYRTVWVVDFEYCRHPTGLPDVVCLSARELYSGRLINLWRDQLGDIPPYDIGEDTLFVCYSGMEAELACHLVLGWPLPANVVDLMVEYRMAINGISDDGAKFSLLGALARFDLPLQYSPAEKNRIRERVTHGWPFSAEERREIQTYCQSDTDEELALFRHLSPGALSPWAVWRGRFIKAVARMWYRGVPIAPRYARLATDHLVRLALRQRIIDDLRADFPVFDGLVLKQDLLAEVLTGYGIPIPRTATERVAVAQERLGHLARDYPVLGPFVEAQHTLAQLKEFSLPLGSDLRLRAWFAPFLTKTSRAAPPTNGYIYNLPAWMRSTMEIPQGHAVIYFDWSAMEFGLAAAVSGDRNMRAFYQSGDPYLASAVAFGDLAPGATKDSHPGEREIYKTGLLACQYGIGADKLANRLKRPGTYAARFLHRHHEVFHEYWTWSDGVVAEAIRSGQYVSRHGWVYAVHPPFNLQSLRNWPIQTLGADILRTACIFADQLGLEMLATAHDAILALAPLDRRHEVAAEMMQCMTLASSLLTDGFELRVDKVEKLPGDRFVEKRGLRTLQVVDRFLSREELRA